MARYCSKICKNNKSKIGFGIISFILCITIFVCPILLKKNNKSYAHEEKSSYIVIENSSHRVLKAYNAHIKLPMASTTKIMTALIVLEKVNLNEVITIPNEAVGIEGSSIYLKKGDKMSIKDLLYGLMLRSGNDAAVALAIHTAGSVDKFVELMNDKVKDLGLNNTHFANPHGLSAKNHYTSSYDLAIITSEAFKNSQFKEIVSTKMHVVKGETEEENRYFANKNRILYSYDGACGVKTGYTMEAGRCLVTSSIRNGMQVIAVALNHYNYFDLCASLMDYAHSNYKLEKPIDSQKSYKMVDVKRGRKVKEAELHTLVDKYYPVKQDGTEEIKYEVDAIDLITAPHNKENSCGEVKIYVGNDLIFTEKLYTIYNIEKKSIFDFLR